MQLLALDGRWHITYANASQLARVLNDIFATSGQQNANPLQMMFGGAAQRGGRQRR